MIAITVDERISNAAPTINAGNPVTIDAGDATCQLSGYSYICDECESVTVNLGVGASVSDPDGDVYAHLWTVLALSRYSQVHKIGVAESSNVDSPFAW